MIKFIEICMVFAFPLVWSAWGQAIPAAQGPSSYEGFQLPSVGGTMSFGITASEDVNVGYNGSDATTAYTNISGDLAFLTKSQRHPVSMVYSGGYFIENGGGTSSVYQNLALSQVFVAGKWTFLASNSLSYLPETSSIGLSGVPGTGDLGALPVPSNPGTGQGILTDIDARISNYTTGSVQRNLTASTSVAGSAGYGFTKFVGDSSATGLNSSYYTAAGSLSHRLSAIDSVSANYSYSEFSYPVAQLSDQSGDISSSAATVSYNRQINRRFSVSVSAGPQWTHVPGEISSGSSLNTTASAGLNYLTRSGSVTLDYVRGTNVGSGVVVGARSDSIQGSANRRFSRLLNGAASIAYSHSNSLQVLDNSTFVSNTLVIGGQLNRPIIRTVSAFASYNVERQSFQGSAATSNVFRGLSQVIAFGFSYSPGVVDLSRR